VNFYIVRHVIDIQQRFMMAVAAPNREIAHALFAHVAGGHAGTGLPVR
jgi:hypothetical protein